MARYLILWRRNSAAPWPTDPTAYSKLTKQIWGGIDDLMKKGQVKEFGYFVDGKSGFAIGEGETIDVFSSALAILPYIEFEVHEIVPYEKGKEVQKALIRLVEDHDIK